MKKIVLLLLTVTVYCLSASGQAKKPTIMVVPGEIWCLRNGYMQQYDNMGTMQSVSDYRTAIRTSTELLNVITQINMLMQDRGFPLVDLSAAIRSLEQMQAMTRAMQSSTSGSVIAESPLDELQRQANADILVEVDWTVESNGPRNTLTYNLRGLDSYTKKPVATAFGRGAPSSSAGIGVLLEEAVLAYMDNFTDQLQMHFDDLFTNGREVMVYVNVFEGQPINLETEFNGYELAEIIDDWMALNTVEHRFTKRPATGNFVVFDQVRIPLMRPNGMPMDTEAFVRELNRYLSAAPYNITSKIVPNGLGSCWLIIGEK